MDTSPQSSSSHQLLKTLGPGLLFASAAIGVSHLVLSTRAGAHHGMAFFGIILGALLLKYPFYEFGPRYANATGYSLVKGYRDQGKWAVYLFLGIVAFSMIAVTAAMGAVSAGLLSTMFGITFIPVPILSGVILAITAAILLLGGYKGLDSLVKVISVVLLVTVVTAFVSVLVKGPLPLPAEFQSTPILAGPGLALFIGLLGWMPAGLEAATMNSIWTVEKIKATGYHPKLGQSLWDFRIGYIFSVVLALMFLTIGAYTVYGSGQLLEGNATQFSNKLLHIFTANLGDWSYYVIALAAFGAIYGTLITIMDAFPRCFIRGIRVLKYDQVEINEVQTQFLESAYKICVVLVAIGGFLLFYLSTAGMVALLDGVTIISFILSPILAFLNLKAIQSPAVPDSHKPSSLLMILAYLGLGFLVVFAGYYLYSLG